MTTARNRALDHLRRVQLHDAQARGARRTTWKPQEALVVPDFTDALDAARQDEIGDDLLRLMFTACHPVLPTDARVALTLQAAGRPDHARDRPRVPGARAHHRAAHRARQAEAARGPRAVRVTARRRELQGAPRFGAARWSTSCSTRATRPRPATTGCGPALAHEALRLGAHAGRADAGRGRGRTGWPRCWNCSPRACMRAPTRRAGPSCWPTRTAAAGTGC